MNKLNVIVPAIVTAVITVLGVFAAIWLTGLVPPEAKGWAELIKAGTVIFIVGSLLLVIAWSAYFTYAVSQSLKRQ